MARTSRPISITLGDLQEHADARVRSGGYASVSEVMRAAVRALDREEAAVTEWLRQKVDEAFADLRPSVPALEAEVPIVRIVYGGRDFERALRGGPED